MAHTDIVTLDLNFQGTSTAIAAYLVRHARGAVLVECGPGSTVEALQAGLAAHNLLPRDVTHVLLTHIHLDHAGAAGWFASHGAKIVVHPVGAPHLQKPEKLLRSARRIYKDEMDELWGEFLAVPASSIITPADGEEIRIEGLEFTPIYTPGHAEHHLAYVFEDTCFSGDIGGVRIPDSPLVRIPMPPPELDLEKWQASVGRLRSMRLGRIAPTHFGIYPKPEAHLHELEVALQRVIEWLPNVMSTNPDVVELRSRFLDWMTDEETSRGLSADAIKTHSLANPLAMSADGLFRYWHKVRGGAPA